MKKVIFEDQVFYYKIKTSGTYLTRYRLALYNERAGWTRLFSKYKRVGISEEKLHREYVENKETIRSLVLEYRKNVNENGDNATPAMVIDCSPEIENLYK